MASETYNRASKQ